MKLVCSSKIRNVMKKLMFVFSILLVSGCTTLSKDVVLVSEGGETSKLLVYRDSAFQNAMVSLYVGKSDEYFMKLRNGQYGVVEMDAGPYVIQAKADASPSSLIQVNLKPDEITCLEGAPNKQALGAVFSPLMANAVPAFLLTQVDCPSAEALKDYKLVTKP